MARFEFIVFSLDSCKIFPLCNELGPEPLVRVRSRIDQMVAKLVVFDRAVAILEELIVFLKGKGVGSWQLTSRIVLPSHWRRRLFTDRGRSFEFRSDMAVFGMMSNRRVHRTVERFGKLWLIPFPKSTRNNCLMLFFHAQSASFER